MENQKVGQSFLPSNESEMPNFVPWKLTYTFKRKAKMVCLFGDTSDGLPFPGRKTVLDFTHPRN
jgi:hypothetical protein